MYGRAQNGAVIDWSAEPAVGQSVAIVGEEVTEFVRGPQPSQAFVESVRGPQPLERPSPIEAAVRVQDVFKGVTPILPEIRDILKRATELPKPEQRLETRGRKPENPWDRALSAVWGRIYRGEVTPKKQIEVEKLLADWFDTNCGGYVPAPSEIRKRAKIIWTDLQQE